MFRAFRIFDDAGKVASRFADLELDDLDAGSVVIRVHYSSVNYKDALAATGMGKIVRRFPCVGGIDAAGTVESSEDARFNPGDEVLVTGYDLGVAHDGGYAGFCRVPAGWVVKLPEALTLFDAMALGTAGFTAALSIHRLEQNEITPQSGRIVVTGATGGVGSLAVSMLANRGYHVVAVTGKDSEHEYLQALGAAEILPRSAIDLAGTRALDKAQWAGALDAVGGTTLAWLLRTMQQNGTVAAFGNAGGAELNTTVFPFILRGARLIGIDSAATPMGLRESIWQRLATDLRPPHLAQLTRTIPFAQLPEAFPEVLQARSRGRTVVAIKSQ
jgi:acrylyl-CoA reductase (NADPH)